MLLTTLLAGCVARPGMEALAPANVVSPNAQTVTVHVATTRDRRNPDRNEFTTDRSRVLNFAEYTISIPPTHRPGRIEWPRVPPDPARSFAVRRDSLQTAQLFAASLESRRCGAAEAEIIVFVHGFNMNFPEAVFRAAQMSADTDPRTISILFAWPSDGSMFRYVADRDSVMYSRDHLAGFLADLTRLCARGRVTLIGHSMGAWLTVEALRQLRLTQRDDVLRRLRVALAAPDIDVEVFRAQMNVIGPLSPPMVVLVSPDDAALSVSGRLAGARQRLGQLNVDDPEVQETARVANLTIVDISSAEASNGLNHDRYVGFSMAYARMVAADQAEASLRQAGAWVFNRLGTAVSVPFVSPARLVQCNERSGYTGASANSHKGAVNAPCFGQVARCLMVRVFSLSVASPMRVLSTGSCTIRRRC